MNQHSRSLLLQKLDALEAQHGVALSEEKRRRLERLDALVEKWNRAIALVGFQKDEDRIERYFIEALHSSLWLPAEGHAVDIGSGGGTPVLPLAIQNPGIQWTLLEPNRKKAVFLEEAVGSVTSGNATVLRCRLEDFEPRTEVVAVTTRGISIGPEFFQAVDAWMRPGGRVFFYTGSNKTEAIERIHAADWRMGVKIPLAFRYSAELLVAERS